MSRMKIFTPCWGEKHIWLFKNALMKSLSWPKNLKAIEGAEFVIICETQTEADEIQNHVRSISPNFDFHIYLAPGIDKVDRGSLLIHPIRYQVKECLQRNEPLLMATPDFIFGDGTIDVFKKVACDPGSCVSIAHLRVLPGILGHIPASPVSNRSLITKAREFSHRAFSESPENLYYSGIRIINLSETQFALQHYMPSPFFVNFTKDDERHFLEADPETGVTAAFGMWDHLWPSHLIKENRLRFIGDSQSALILEVTDKDQNVPPIDLEGRPGFMRNHFHNQIQSQFISIFRGE